MKEIDGKSFPTVWSDLEVDPGTVERLDIEPAISVACISDWLGEYHDMNDTASMDMIDDLLKRGDVLQSYLVSVKWRIHTLYKVRDLMFKRWKSQTTSTYTSGGTKELSEAARERMVINEEQYNTDQINLIKLESMEGWCDDMLKSLRDHLSELRLRLQTRLQAQPKFGSSQF